MNIKNKIIELHIDIVDRHAVYRDAPAKLVCGNPFNIIFSFDEEWDEFVNIPKKTKLRFWRRGKYEHIIIEFTGNVCSVPALFGVKHLEVGVFIDNDISTTTGAAIDCEKSIRCDDSTEVFGAEAIDNINNALKGEDGQTPYIKDGYWWIGETNTEVKAEGSDGKAGKAGKDGKTPYIGENHNWWIGETDTGVQALGEQLNRTDCQEISENASAVGDGSFAGCTGFRIIERVNNGNGKGTYTLDGYTGGYEVGDEYSIRYEYFWDRRGKITAIRGNKVTVSNYVTTQTEMLSDQTEDRNTFWVPEKPEIGNLDLGQGALATGVGCKALREGANAGGIGSVAEAKGSVADGLGCLASDYGARADGRGTKARGQMAHATNWNTEANAEASFAANRRTKANAKNAATFGWGTEATAPNQFVAGRNNLKDASKAFILGSGWFNGRQHSTYLAGDGVSTTFCVTCNSTGMPMSPDSEPRVYVNGVEVFNYTIDEDCIIFDTPPAKGAYIYLDNIGSDIFRNIFTVDFDGNLVFEGKAYADNGNQLLLAKPAYYQYWGTGSTGALAISLPYAKEYFNPNFMLITAKIGGVVTFWILDLKCISAWNVRLMKLSSAGVGALDCGSSTVKVATSSDGTSMNITIPRVNGDELSISGARYDCYIF